MARAASCLETGDLGRSLCRIKDTGIDAVPRSPISALADDRICCRCDPQLKWHHGEASQRASPRLSRWLVESVHLSGHELSLSAGEADRCPRLARYMASSAR